MNCPNAMRACAHCGGPRTGRGEGLCLGCFRDGAVRLAYHGVPTPVVAPRRLPRRPTRHRPGTAGKVEVMARRLARGESLFHPLDGRADTQ